jgi:HAD superfamily hydrolase (TIGR01549 family)
MSNPAAAAIVWDFDGTLVDSRLRNLSVTRAIVEHITGRPAATFAALVSVEDYRAADARCTNWREFYHRELELDDTDLTLAGRLWREFQERERTPMPLYDGIAETLGALRTLPHGIFSQNSRDNIASTLRATSLDSYFRVVIGFEEVGANREKPWPDGFLMCVESLTRLRPGRVFYVGDHETDALCAANARTEILERDLGIEVITIAALYGAYTPAAWTESCDHCAAHPSDVVDIVASYAY